MVMWRIALPVSLFLGRSYELCRCSDQGWLQWSDWSLAADSVGQTWFTHNYIIQRTLQNIAVAILSGFFSRDFSAVRRRVRFFPEIPPRISIFLVFISLFEYDDCVCKYNTDNLIVTINKWIVDSEVRTLSRRRSVMQGVNEKWNNTKCV